MSFREKVLDVVFAVLALLLAGLVAALIFLVLSTAPAHRFLPLDAFAVYEKLRKASDSPKSVPPLHIVESRTINANAKTERIVLFSGMLGIFKTDSEMAAILAHEIAHVLLDHVKLLELKKKPDSRLLEANADKLGVALMMRAGYNICDAKNIWSRLRDMNGNNPLTYSHPSYSDRYYELSYPQCEK